jgi:hypothetical protein
LCTTTGNVGTRFAQRRAGVGGARPVSGPLPTATPACRPGGSSARGCVTGLAVAELNTPYYRDHPEVEVFINVDSQQVEAVSGRLDAIPLIVLTRSHHVAGSRPFGGGGGGTRSASCAIGRHVCVSCCDELCRSWRPRPCTRMARARIRSERSRSCPNRRRAAVQESGR